MEQLLTDGALDPDERTFRIGHMGDHTMDGLENVLEATAESIEDLLNRG